MTALDFAPAPGAAPAVRRVLTQARTEARLLLRNGEQLLLALVIPIGLLVLGRTVGGQFLPFDALVPSVLALAVWSTCFTTLAISTGFERRYGVLERLAVTPLGRSGLLWGKAVAILAVTAGQLVILSGVGLGLGWRPALDPAAWLLALLITALGGVCYAALALLLAGLLRSEITLALANLIYLLGLSVGGVIVPTSQLPGWLAAIVAWLPTAVVADALRAASLGAGLAADWGFGLAITVGWGVILVAISRRVFNWLG